MLTKISFALAIIIGAASGALADTKKQAPGPGPGGSLTTPYYQGTPLDRMPIYRHGSYQGNDPDQNIRLQLMRDGRNSLHE